MDNDVTVLVKGDAVKSVSNPELIKICLENGWMPQTAEKPKEARTKKLKED